MHTIYGQRELCDLLAPSDYRDQSEEEYQKACTTGRGSAGCAPALRWQCTDLCVAGGLTAKSVGTFWLTISAFLYTNAIVGLTEAGTTLATIVTIGTLHAAGDTGKPANAGAIALILTDGQGRKTSALGIG